MGPCKFGFKIAVECASLTAKQVSWVPGVFEGQGAATLYFDNFTKHPAYQGIVEALTNKTKPDDCDEPKPNHPHWRLF